ncbi:MAG: hypothetical protein FOGNACKC_05788 [Anaerolineae bacterium]|nr:hypothetical protein [Anaerolineae bacterium]
MKVHLQFRWLSLVVLLLLLTTGLATAHAGYDHSEPAAEAVLATPPAEVHVWFAEELFRQAGANSLAVFGPTGAQVDRGDSRIDDDDRSHMLVSLADNLPNGRYTVRWQTSSADDGDEDSGEFGFTVGTTALAVAQTQPAADVAVPLASPTATGSLLPCLGGLVFGVLAVGMALAPGKQKWGGIF